LNVQSKHFSVLMGSPEVRMEEPVNKATKGRNTNILIFFIVPVF
jgi:hypothetical protein